MAYATTTYLAIAAAAALSAGASKATGHNYMWDFSLGGGGLPPQQMPEMPEAPEPDAPIEAGDEGIRKGSMLRETKSKQQRLFVTRGQPRQNEMTLGGYRQTLA